MFHSKRRLTGLGLLLTLVLLLAACVVPAGTGTGDAPAAGDAPTAEQSAASDAATDFQIGLVTDVGRINDRSFNQSAWEGVVQAGEALGLTEGEGYRYIETQAPTDYAENIQQFVDGGFQVIVTVGFALGAATLEAAAANPDIHFIGVDQFQGEALPNVTGLIFHEDQSGFLAGALAAQLTKSGMIAAVLGTDSVPPVVAFKEGYELGAKYINPDIKFISTYHPGDIAQAFTDPEW
ncbi:MAG: BMP family ABC transporter substrate-binding protein, partial [Chloroflexota bacterium]|nr:BMP family ABC transporter substrate-binding protein [Chloroflexota bacterium]